LVLPQSVIDQGAQMAGAAVPPAVRDPLVHRIESFSQQSHGIYAVLGAALAVWGARGGLTSLITALNTMFHKQETRSWLRRQLTAIIVTIGMGVLVVLALALLVVGPLVGHWVADRFGLGGAFDVAWGIGRWIGAGLLVMLVWAIIYKFLPNTDAPFRIFTPGAISGVLLWLAMSYAFGVYLGHFNRYEATYGALGGAIIFLTWLWLSNMALLVGAEVNDILADMRKDESPAAAQLADPHEHAHAPA
ncbi:MAG: YihY/virulence factor BrkB family protein, partial [Acidobacteriota bacterium]